MLHPLCQPQAIVVLGRDAAVAVAFPRIPHQPHRHLPKLLSAAAAVVVVAWIGVGVVIATKDQAADSSAGIGPSVLPSGIPSLSAKDVGPDAQQWLESTNGPLLNGSDAEKSCARAFASGRPNPVVRLVQPAKVDGKRAVLIGLQGGSPRDIQIFAVTGCSDGGAASPFYDTNITLRNR